VGVGFGRPAPLGKIVFGLKIDGAEPEPPELELPDPLAGAGLAGRTAVGAGRGAGFDVLGFGAGAGADSRVELDGFGADRVVPGAVAGLAAAGTAVGDPRISNGGR
jgi:hypothetical protein